MDSLPNKDKVEKINFYGNNIKEVDLATILTQFPNLKALNLENNPVRAKNCGGLTKEQVKVLITKIKNRQFKVNSYKGTVLMDLLEHAQHLITPDEAHYLKSLIQQEKPTQPANSTASSGGVVALAMGGLVLALLLMLLIGYHWGKKKNDDE